MFKSRAHVDIVHVAYAGGGPANAAVIGGQVDITFGNISAVIPHIRTGRLKALGITSIKRSPAAPDIPTIAEQGLPDYDFSSWFGVLAPAGTSRSIIARLNSAIVTTVGLSEVKARLETDGTELVTCSPEEFEQYLKSEKEKWFRVLNEAGITPD